MNIIDRVLIYIVPHIVARREFSRMSIERMTLARSQVRKYEAASSAGRLAIWGASDGSANTEIKDSIAIMRYRARALVRDNPWASHAIDVISTLVVGDGISPQLNHAKNPQGKAVTTALNLWSDWAESTACDHQGERNLVQMQSAVMEAVATDGEVFLIRHKMTGSQMKKVAVECGIEKVVPLQLQLLECDFLDHTKNEVHSDGSRVIQGVEYDSAGRRTAYHFYVNHPGEYRVLNMGGRDTVRVPASRVRHIFRKDRLHQTRGVTWFTRVMIRLRELDIFEDGTLRKQQISACYAGFRTSAGDDNDDDEEIAVLEKLESGTIERLPNGESMVFSDPPDANDYPAFTKMQLLAIASGLGITFESLTQDLGNVNFSSGRMGHIGMARKVRKWQKQIIQAQMMDPVFIWWRDAADLVTPGNVDMQKIWTYWTMPAREVIDPSKEGAADHDAIAAGTDTLSNVLRSLGKDPDTVFQERAAELKRMDELGIKTDSDPRMDAGSAGGTPSNNPDEEDVEDEDAEDTENPDEDSLT